MPRNMGIMVLALLLIIAADDTRAEPAGGPPTYERSRHGYEGGYDQYDRHQPRWEKYDYRNHHSRSRPRRNERTSAQVSAGTFQRPYPYHLDYYRMRWGGSYAPYFGNLYGPPNVVLGAPYGYFGGGFYGDGFSNRSGVPFNVPNSGGFGEGEFPVPYEAPPVVVP